MKIYNFIRLCRSTDRTHDYESWDEGSIPSGGTKTKFMQGNSHGESRNARADKMSGTIRCKELVGKSKKYEKKFYSKKRREFLKDRQNDDKI